MDVVLGLLFWGGLLALTLVWVARTGLTGKRRSGYTRQPGTPAAGRRDAPSAWSSTTTPGAARPTAHHPRRRDPEEQRLREDEALADGLVIGHFLTRDHYRREIADLEGQLDDATAERQRWEELAGTGDDLHDVLDHAEFDAMGGFGVEPWADDLFDLDEED